MGVFVKSRDMMRTYIIFLLISCIFVPLETKYTKRQKTIIKKFKKQRQIAYDLEVELNSLNSTLDTLEKLTEVSTRHRLNVALSHSAAIQQTSIGTALPQMLIMMLQTPFQVEHSHHRQTVGIIFAPFQDSEEQETLMTTQFV